MDRYSYVSGDATRPKVPGTKVICHCCNDIGGWGSGFVVAVSHRWPAPEGAYRTWHRNGKTHARHPLGAAPTGDSVPFALGKVQFVQVEPDLWVANIIGQHKTISSGERRPVRYEALEQGLEAVREFCDSNEASVHMPRMGAGLAGGSWDIIEPIIKRTLVRKGVDVTVYDYVSG